MADYQEVKMETGSTPAYTEEQLAAANADTQVDEPMQEEVVEEQRPEWLPEKFSDAEALAKAYRELESQQSQPKTEEPDDGGLNPLSAEDFMPFNQEISETGDLSPESYAEMVGWGLPEEIVKSHVAGQKALVELQLNNVYGAVGGPENYGQMIEWAKSSLQESDVRAFDEAVTKGSEDQMMFAVRSLAAQWQASGGNSQPLIQGGTSAAGASGAFRSLAEMTVAMKDPRYQKDPAYRQDVQNRLSNSNIM